MKSNFLNLNWADFGKGAVVAVLTAVFTTLLSLLQTGTLFAKASLPIIGTAALTAFLGYLSKQFLTNSQGQLMTTEKNATPEKVKPIQSHPLTKILILAVILTGIGLNGNAQGLLKSVPMFPVKQTADRLTGLNYKSTETSGAWFWEFDGAIDLAEVNYNTELKVLVPSSARTVGVGPCIGYQHFIPKSATDGTPVNNYGFAGGVLFGDKFKFVLQGNW